MHWMPLALAEVEKEKPGFKFFGSDVVCPLITQHKASFSNRTNWAFDCIDYGALPWIYTACDGLGLPPAAPSSLGLHRKRSTGSTRTHACASPHLHSQPAAAERL